MTAQGFVWLLLIQYAIAAVWFAIEGNRPKALYFLGSVVLTLGVLWME
jgi:hypothetical protein